MTEKAKKYLSDILSSIQRIEAFTVELREFTDYQSDLRTKSAVERQLGIVGEAVNKFRKEEPGYPLTHAKQIVDFRNWIIHAYDNIDDAIVWAILKNHLPVLKSEVAKGLNA
jgi:uncharacterized protein with HEPN domain